MRALIYPYSKEFEPFIKYGKCIDSIEVFETLSPVGWGVQDKLGEILNKNSVTEVNWYNIDALLLIDSGAINLNNLEILDVVTYAAKNGKKVIVNRNIDDDTFLGITEICGKEQVELIDMRKYIKEGMNDKRIKKIATPIILVAGMGEKCDKLSVQVFLQSYYKDLGYKVCVVSSRTNSELYGMHSFPSFMFGNTLDETSKIINFNHYIKMLEEIENPDIIIIGVPGEVMPVSDKHSEHFGIFAFEVFNAIKCDVLLFCMHNNNYFREYFEEVKKLCEYRFHSKVDAFVIANHAYDCFSLETEGNLKYLSFSNEEVEKHFSQYPENVYGSSTYEKLAEYVLDILAEYGEYQIM